MLLAGPDSSGGGAEAAEALGCAGPTGAEADSSPAVCFCGTPLSGTVS